MNDGASDVRGVRGLGRELHVPSTEVRWQTPQRGWRLSFFKWLALRRVNAQEGEKNGRRAGELCQECCDITI